MNNWFFEYFFEPKNHMFFDPSIVETMDFWMGNPPQSLLAPRDVEQIQASGGAFAAIRADGKARWWWRWWSNDGSTSANHISLWKKDETGKNKLFVCLLVGWLLGCRLLWWRWRGGICVFFFKACAIFSKRWPKSAKLGSNAGIMKLNYPIFWWNQTSSKSMVKFEGFPRFQEVHSLFGLAIQWPRYRWWQVKSFTILIEILW